MKKQISLWAMLFLAHITFAQFHTLKIPQASNKVTETQTLGVTDITIDYHSPKARGRDVWNDTDVIPQEGNPIAWRAGANMNTTISFSTDVSINGKSLKAGKYGIHVIPTANEYRILFAHANDQWGSYYLDIEKDITLEVIANSEESPFTEKLDYEFYNDSDDQMTIAIEWDKQRLPFQVKVDLNKTTIESFRSELRGINTYHWQAWNDAARWCLNRDVNLEEALEWANRSINGGYGGFAANKNVQNITTKVNILEKLGRNDEMKATIEEGLALSMTAMESNNMTFLLFGKKMFAEAETFNAKSADQFPDQWYIQLNYGLSQYLNGNTKKAAKTLEKNKSQVPNNFTDRYAQIIEQVKDGTYKLRGS